MCPLRVKLIVVFFIIYTIISGAAKGFVLLNSEMYENAKLIVEAAAMQGLINIPFSFQVAHAVIGVVIVPVSGVYMWLGKSWALYLFTFWVASALLLTLLVTGFSIHFLAKIPLAIIFLAVLYTGKAGRYLIAEDETSNE